MKVSRKLQCKLEHELDHEQEHELRPCSTAGPDYQHHAPNNPQPITFLPPKQLHAQYRHHGLCSYQLHAGIAYKGNTFGADEAATTIATNFLGTKAACEALLPLLTKPGGRIVNVSST
jgi:NAD(P)-dependent dehydrogenase (short-subunit alcohol dehydrogenase family)